MEIYKAALIGIAGVLFGLLFKGYREEYTLYLSLTAGLLILFLAGTQLKEVAEAVRLLQENLQIEDSYIRILRKMLLVTYVGQFAAAVCRDCNNSVVAGQIELFARLTLATLGMPVFVALLQLITDILGV